MFKTQSKNQSNEEKQYNNPANMHIYFAHSQRCSMALNVHSPLIRIQPGRACAHLDKRHLRRRRSRDLLSLSATRAPTAIGTDPVRGVR